MSGKKSDPPALQGEKKRQIRQDLTITGIDQLIQSIVRTPPECVARETGKRAVASDCHVRESKGRKDMDKIFQRKKGVFRVDFVKGETEQQADTLQKRKKSDRIGEPRKKALLHAGSSCKAANLQI